MLSVAEPPRPYDNPFAWEGDFDEVAAVLSASTRPFYVYVLLRRAGEPFYVGKGVKRRVLQHEAEAKNTTRRSHKLNIIRTMHRAGAHPRYAIAAWFDNESDAHALERKLVLEIGRHDLGTGPLTNQTDGGEGTSNPSQESIARRAANLGGNAEDPERRVANQFFHSIAGQQDSVPIKPLGARKLEPTTPHPSSRRATQRMAVALVAAALASEQLLSAGTILPRRFSIDDRVFVIENGVAKDMLKAGMILLEPGAATPDSERFLLTPLGYRAVITLLGRDRLIDLGVLDPDDTY